MPYVLERIKDKKKKKKMVSEKRCLYMTDRLTDMAKSIYLVALEYTYILVYTL